MQCFASVGLYIRVAERNPKQTRCAQLFKLIARSGDPIIADPIVAWQGQIKSLDSRPVRLLCLASLLHAETALFSAVRYKQWHYDFVLHGND